MVFSELYHRGRVPSKPPGGGGGADLILSKVTLAHPTLPWYHHIDSRVFSTLS